MWTMSKALRAPVVDVMDDYDLFRAFELFAAAENQEASRRQREQERKARASHGVAGRRRR